jgi:voltage-gated potassium channel
VSAGLVILATVVYYLVPVPGRMSEGSWAILFGCGSGVLAVLILLSIRKLLPDAGQVKLRGIVLLLVLTVLFFSWCDRSLAELPGQFVSLQNKTDALYFNVSTLATVGFGDVHPQAQLARAAVTVQIVFNLVFLGAAAGVISGLTRQRAATRAQTRASSRNGRDEAR